MDRESLSVCFRNQFHHLIMIVKALRTVIPGLIEVILKHPARMSFDYTVQKHLGTDDIIILVAVLRTRRGNTGDLCFRVFSIVRNNHIGISAKL